MHRLESVLFSSAFHCISTLSQECENNLDFSDNPSHSVAMCVVYTVWG